MLHLVAEKGVCMNKRVVMLILSLSMAVTTFSRVMLVGAYTSINVSTSYNMITSGSFPDLVVLDVREEGEYNIAHIYGAVWIPVEELGARIGELSGHENHEIIVYCASGGRSIIASNNFYSKFFS